ncbi:MAG: bifunctional diaminohydroxyphosphoribosylaminopyrimidine deaminase/5-amino-6-(5-phosphoribosylamino)uracil reductase RibD [Pseudomonadota bacterium]|nr:bifunctional diaminohydroxyphosphoribosylaminopyrimidine deaminase/5-amino-6-(5-phosphoribosylamino)uracil reductase RibD [Pseudomonadota bacterium]
MTAVPSDCAADRVQMARALELAGRGLYTTHPNPRVGCVVARDGQIIGEGWHVRAGEPHAEVLALRGAGSQARGATVYVTLEPCSHTGRTPPCADALIAAGVAHVVCATVDPNPRVAGAGIKRLAGAGIDVTVGILEEQARALNPGFFSRFERGRPFIRLKLAMSLDARTSVAGPERTAPAGGKSWITDDASRADVQTWRARSSAVLTGAGTVREDDPRLDVRLAYGPWVRQPLRVVLDPDLSCPPDSKIFGDENALIFAALGAPELREVQGGAAQGSRAQGSGAQGGREAQGHEVQARSAPGTVREPVAGVRIERVPRAGRGLDLAAVIERLTALEVNELLVECGPRLAAAFLEADLVDELILYVAPHFLGMDAAPLAALLAAGAAGLPRFEFRDLRLLENDLRLVLVPQRT